MSESEGISAKKPLWRPKTRFLNRAMQIVMLAVIGQWSFYGIFRCPFIVPYINCQNCPVITCHGRIFSLFWGFWIGWGALAVFFGRAFCGWLCPGGFANRLLGVFSRLRPKRESLIQTLLPFGKYFGLALALWVLLQMDQPRVNVPIRVGEFFPAIAQTWNFAQPIWIVRTIFVLAILALGILLPAAWCRFACPTGGSLEIVRRFSIFRIFKTDACNDCDRCKKACYMDTRPEENDCTNCGDCIHSCPQKCIGMGRKR
jgi:polyferredoxin